jgi:hypothetical protein
MCPRIGKIGRKGPAGIQEAWNTCKTGLESGLPDFICFLFFRAGSGREISGHDPPGPEWGTGLMLSYSKGAVPGSGNEIEGEPHAIKREGGD